MIREAIAIVLLASCAAGCIYWLAALACLRAVLRRPTTTHCFCPFVSILKPVKGVDSDALENFITFCIQDYPQFELLFGVADADDPVVELVEKLKQRFPDRPIRLLVAEPLGTNPKAAILHALSGHARGEVLVISDSDIRVTPDYLRRVVAPLQDPSVGLVTCLYRGERPLNTPARLEALHMDAAFAPSAALAWRLGTRVGLGATMALRASDLSRAGGYAAIADHLLDDHEVASRIARLGLTIEISDCPVACLLGELRFPEQWRREVRWVCGIRTAYPLQYPGLLVTFSTPLALAALIAGKLWPLPIIALCIALAIRWFVGWRSAALLGQRERGYLLWLPVRDVLSAAVWFAGLVGNRVTWRGNHFELRSDGRLDPIPGKRLPSGPLARAIRRLDAYLRRRDGIFEFNQDERCMLRVSVTGAEAEMEFADGTRVRPGEPVCALHLWNEHMVTIPKAGADLKWAMQMQRGMSRSLAQLAEAALHDPRLADARAFGANAVFVMRQGDAQVARMVGRFGFEWVSLDRRPTFRQRLHRFGENFLLLGLQWAFNPAGLRCKVFGRHRNPLWMSRRMLLDRYGRTASSQQLTSQPVTS